MIVKDTVEEHIYRSAVQKLKLDQSLSKTDNDNDDDDDVKVGSSANDEPSLDVSTVLKVLREELR